MWKVYCCAREGRTKPTQRTPKSASTSDALGLAPLLGADQSIFGAITDEDTGEPAPKSLDLVEKLAFDRSL